MRISIPQDMFLLAGILFCGAAEMHRLGSLAICLIFFAMWINLSESNVRCAVLNLPMLAAESSILKK